MTFGFPAEPYDVDPIMVKALDLLLILHADHEQNCSTSTVRLVGSAQANLFASVSAGINALFGPLHGGANQAVLEMLQQIQDNGGDVGEFVRKVKNKEDGVKLMGFGHRVYKNYDPRAAIVKKTADEVLEKLGIQDPLLDIALQLEEVALTDDYFIERKLYPNVDFYTGLIYKAMGFPTKMFTVLFALGRLPGWIAQWREMIEDPETKIGRPRQVYTGRDRAQVHRPRRPLSTGGPRRPPPYDESGPPPAGEVGRSRAAARRSRATAESGCDARWRQPAGTGGRHRRAGALPGPGALVPAAAPRAVAHGDRHGAVVLGVGHGPRPGRPGARGRGLRQGDRPPGGPARSSPSSALSSLTTVAGGAVPGRVGEPAAEAAGGVAGQGRGEQPALLLVVGVGLGEGAALDLLGDLGDRLVS